MKIIIRTNILLKPYEMKQFRELILRQVEDGVVVLPPYAECIMVDDENLKIEFEDDRDADAN